jgi:aminoglycoside phosphotransferase (APT) family kinase protein
MDMDIEQAEDLRNYLLATGRLEPDEAFDMQVLAGGVSNRTVLLRRSRGENWVLKQALAKLRVQVDWFSNPERIQREAAGMRHLHRFAPRNITRLIFEDATEHVLAMEAVAEPHENWKSMLLKGNLKQAHLEQFATLLATIHHQAFLAKDELQEAFSDRSYFENLRLEPYYLYTAEQVPEAHPFLNQLVADTRQRLFTLVHGDYSPKNVLVQKDKLILLDHEVIHFGDPAFDLGFAFCHLLSKAHHVRAARKAFAEAALGFWPIYVKGIATTPFYADLEAYAVKHTLACLLARVRGRSPLEYLSQAEQEVQESVVLALIRKNIKTMPQLISTFVKGVADVSHSRA